MTIADRKTVREMVRTKDVVGVTVKSKELENLGKIEEIVLDKFTGKTCYVVLSFGGLLGIGDKLFALPWEILNYDPDEESFIIDIPKEKLKEAPGFDKDNWPAMDDKWSEGIFDYYQVRPYWKDRI